MFTQSVYGRVFNLVFIRKNFCFFMERVYKNCEKDMMLNFFYRDFFLFFFFLSLNIKYTYDMKRSTHEWRRRRRKNHLIVCKTFSDATGKPNHPLTIHILYATGWNAFMQTNFTLRGNYWFDQNLTNALSKSGCVTKLSDQNFECSQKYVKNNIFKTI